MNDKKFDDVRAIRVDPCFANSFMVWFDDGVTWPFNRSNMGIEFDPNHETARVASDGKHITVISRNADLSVVIPVRELRLTADRL